MNVSTPVWSMEPISGNGRILYMLFTRAPPILTLYFDVSL